MEAGMSAKIIRQFQARCAAAAKVDLSLISSRDKRVPVVNARYASLLMAFEWASYVDGRRISHRGKGFIRLLQFAFKRKMSAIYYARATAKQWLKTDRGFSRFYELAKHKVGRPISQPCEKYLKSRRQRLQRETRQARNYRAGVYWKVPKEA
jgi:hypothetical protein